MYIGTKEATWLLA